MKLFRHCSAHDSGLHKFIWRKRHSPARIRFLRWLSRRGCILGELCVVSKSGSVGGSGTVEPQYNFLRMGNNRPRLRIGQRADRPRVWMSRQFTCRAEARTTGYRNDRVLLGRPGFALQHRTAACDQWRGDSRASVSTQLQTRVRFGRHLWRGARFFSSLSSGLLTRARLEHFSARRAELLFPLETRRSRFGKSWLQHSGALVLNRVRARRRFHLADVEWSPRTVRCRSRTDLVCSDCLRIQCRRLFRFSPNPELYDERLVLPRFDLPSCGRA
jgi:hypothetical protein